MAATGKAPDGRQERWAQHNRTRRQVIIDAAVDAIGAAGPGEEIHVRQVAERAGLSRTVVYRHFGDRADLDRAVQHDIVDRLRGELIPALSLTGSPTAIVRRIVAAYVGWAVEHPALHRFLEREVVSDEGRPVLDEAVEQIAGQIEGLIVVVVETLRLELDDTSRDGLDPLVFGVVGTALNTVRRWLARPEVAPPREELVDLLSEAIWHAIAGLAAARGLSLDPDVPVERLFEGADGADTGPDRGTPDRA